MSLESLSRNTQTTKTPYLTAPTILRAESLIKIYGKRRVVDGVSFYVNQGEIVGLLGPNGAGKTTSFRMTCGLINTNGGIVYLGSQDVTNWPMYRRSREGGMGYLPQDKSVFQKLSVQNNLLGVMEMLGIKRSERKRRCDELLEKFGLTHLRKNSAGGLSGGERRRLEIARSLVSNPKIILLDEPFAAVDPITVTSIQKIIRQLADEGISILITDHSVQDTLQITERSYVIQAGKVLCHGTPAEVLGNPEARKVYFGENVSVEHLQSTILHSSATVVGQAATISQPPAGTFSSNSESVSMPISTGAGSPESHSGVASKRVLGVKQTKRKTDLSGSGMKEELNRYDAPEKPLPTNSISPIRQTNPVTGPNRPAGKRLTPSASTTDRPLVRSSIAPASHQASNNTIDPDQPAPASSGVMRTLGSLIWGK